MLIVAILARLGGRAQHCDSLHRTVTVRAVAILARLGGRAQPGRLLGARHVTPLGCDPRPARWPGAARVVDRTTITPQLRVAILARLGGRAQLRTHRTTRRVAWCCDPRPARWPGAAWSTRGNRHLPDAVAILARLGGRAQHRGDGRGLHPAVVAILARLGGRAQHSRASAMPACLKKLRSSPGAVAGRSDDGSAATVGGGSVAILARRGGRAQRGRWSCTGVTCGSCDPRPARWPGAA